MKRMATIFSLLVNAALIAIVVGVMVPGPHRFVLPGAYGLTEIAPKVWTDAPQQSERLRGLVERSRATVIRFFGEATKPTVILCSRLTCAQSFGIKGNGLSIAYVAVMVSPGGLTQGTLTHELTHSRLHRSMGLRNLVRQPYPTWFDEGLATHVADHPKWRGTISPDVRDRVLSVRRFWNWDDAYRAVGVGQAYQAAANEVAQIEKRAGRAGLLELIDRAEAGEDFGEVLKAVQLR